MSTHQNEMPALRYKISSPIELLSTSNMITHTSPDIIPGRNVSFSSASSLNSRDESDSAVSDISSPTTSADTSSIDEPHSPVNCSISNVSVSNVSEDSSGLPTPTRSESTVILASSEPRQEVPAIPKRALSHTKSNHQILARKRSQRQIAQQSAVSHNVEQANSSASIIQPSLNQLYNAIVESHPVHPFSNELAQVNELVENFHILGDPRLSELNQLPRVENFGAIAFKLNEEEILLRSRGYFKFTADEYMAELDGLAEVVFEEPIEERTWPLSSAWF